MKMKIVWLAVVLTVLCAVAQAVEVIPLGTDEAARWGATHQIVITEADLTDTNTATFTQTLTGATIRANTAIEPVALALWAPFGLATTSTNYTSTTVTVGDSDSATQFLTATEVNENGSEVYFKWATAQATATTSTNLIYLGAATNVLTNAVLASATAGTTELGRRYYTTANKLTFAFTGTTNYALSALTKGELRFYYRELRVGR